MATINKLTDREIARAKPRQKPYKLTDGGGLYLTILPSGARSWRFNYRVGGKQVTHTYGTYPDVTLKKARELHADARKLKVIGQDPVLAKKQAKREAVLATANTVRAWGEEWFNAQAPGKSQAWIENYRRWLDDRVYPALGSMPVLSVTAPDVLQMLKSIAAEGIASTAEEIRRMLSRIFRYAIVNGVTIDSDPAHACLGAVIVPAPVHHRPLTLKELPSALRAIRGYMGRRQTVIAAELLFLTQLRVSELTGATWDELDLDGEEPQWRVPGNRMKNGLDHIVPLSRQAVELFRELHPLSFGSVYCLPHVGNRSKPMSRSALNVMFERLGLDVSPHCTRATASTLLNECGRFRPDWIERQLAHVERNRVRAAYNAAEYLDDRRTMMQWWADRLDAFRDGGNVVSITSKRACA